MYSGPFALYTSNTSIFIRFCFSFEPQAFLEFPEFQPQTIRRIFLLESRTQLICLPYSDFVWYSFWHSFPFLSSGRNAKCRPLLFSRIISIQKPCFIAEISGITLGDFSLFSYRIWTLRMILSLTLSLLFFFQEILSPVYSGEHYSNKKNIVMAQWTFIWINHKTSVWAAVFRNIFMYFQVHVLSPGTLIVIEGVIWR